MTTFLFGIDKLSAWMGKAFAWCILIMTFGISYEIIARKLFGAPTEWAFDLSYIMYGTLFMMAGAYTLSRGGHVRGDVLYRLWPPRVQASVELLLYIIFYYPGVLALVWVGWTYADQSWGFNMGRGEVSINSPAGVPISQFKSIVPAAAILLVIQGIAEMLRCVICLKNGEWPQRLHDVEELETVLMHEREYEAQQQQESQGMGKGGAR